MATTAARTRSLVSPEGIGHLAVPIVEDYQLLAILACHGDGRGRALVRDGPAAGCRWYLSSTRGQRMRSSGFVEKWRHTNLIPRLLDQQSCLKPTVGPLEWAARRWQGMTMTELEQRGMALLRIAQSHFTDERQTS